MCRAYLLSYSVQKRLPSIKIINSQGFVLSHELKIKYRYLYSATDYSTFINVGIYQYIFEDIPRFYSFKFLPKIFGGKPYTNRFENNGHFDIHVTCECAKLNIGPNFNIQCQKYNRYPNVQFKV